MTVRCKLLRFTENNEEQTHGPYLEIHGRAHLQLQAPTLNSKFSGHTALLGYEDLLGIHSKTILVFAGVQVPPLPSFWELTYSTFAKERLVLCSLAQVLRD